MGMNAIPVVTAGAQMIGGYMQGQSAKEAAQIQAQAGQQAIAAQQQALQQQQAALAPYAGAGQQALQQLITGLAPGGTMTQQYALQQAAQQGMTGATPFQATASPAEQFAQAQAMQAMQNQMAMGGQNLTSNAITGAGQLAGNIASQYEQQAYNQWLTGRQQILAENQAQQTPLFSLANLGQASAAGQAQNIGAAAQNIGQTQMGIANALAAGQVGQAQAQQNMLSGLAGTGMTYYLGQQMQPQQTATQTPAPPGAGMSGLNLASAGVPGTNIAAQPWTPM